MQGAESWRAERYEEAEQTFRQALAHAEKVFANPLAKDGQRFTLVQVSANLARLLVSFPDRKLRKPAEAVKLAKKALEQKRDLPLVWNTLALAHFHDGDSDAAHKALQEVWKITKNGSPWDFFILAMMNERRGAKDDARRQYDQAVQAMEKHGNPPAMLQRLRAEAAVYLGIKKPSKIK